MKRTDGHNQQQTTFKMSSFGSSKKKALRKLQLKWRECPEEQKAHAEFILGELGMRVQGPNEMLERELADLRRADEFEIFRQRWFLLPEEEKSECYNMWMEAEIVKKWHDTFVPRREITDEEIRRITWPEFKRLKEVDEWKQIIKWDDLFKKKGRFARARETVREPAPIQETGQDIQPSPLWSPTMWATAGSRGVDAAMQFLKSRPVLTVESIPDEDCAICCEQFIDEATKLPTEECISLPCQTQHCFHRECLHTWFQAGHFTCPICRSSHRQ